MASKQSDAGKAVARQTELHGIRGSVCVSQSRECYHSDRSVSWVEDRSSSGREAYVRSMLLNSNIESFSRES